MKLTENFDLEEFKCKDGTEVPSKYLTYVRELAENLQVIRDYAREPIHITSGYRTKSWNNKVKGSPRSQHLQAKAADLQTQEMTIDQLENLIENLIRTNKIKEGGVGVYKTWIHYDIRGTKARWRE